MAKKLMIWLCYQMRDIQKTCKARSVTREQLLALSLMAFVSRCSAEHDTLTTSVNTHPVKQG